MYTIKIVCATYTLQNDPFQLCENFKKLELEIEKKSLPNNFYMMNERNKDNNDRASKSTKIAKNLAKNDENQTIENLTFG